MQIVFSHDKRKGILRARDRQYMIIDDSDRGGKFLLNVKNGSKMLLTMLPGSLISKSYTFFNEQSRQFKLTILSDGVIIEPFTKA